MQYKYFVVDLYENNLDMFNKDCCWIKIMVTVGL